MPPITSDELSDLAAVPPITSDELSDLAAEYAAESGLPHIVCLAFLRADRDPPPRARVDRMGYSAAEVKLIEPLLSNLPPL